MAAKDHYENHLARVYSWMIGDFEASKSDQKNFFLQNQISPRKGAVAIDLGAGNGIQSLAIAELGFEVTAIDFNKQLLSQLTENSRNQKIQILEGDIRDFSAMVHGPVSLIVCMGDTITHLDSHQELEKLIQQCAAKLEPGGTLVISYRDLSGQSPNSRKFIPVKSDDTRIMTCLLEFFEDRVRVTDLLYEKSSSKWEFSESSYFKLILPLSQVVSYCREVGLEYVKAEARQGMHYILARKTAP